MNQEAHLGIDERNNGDQEMSWSITLHGRPARVIESAKNQLGAQKCMEPEESIKGKVLEIIEACLSAYGDGTAVKLQASGSQYNPDLNDKQKLNSLSLSIEPLWNFLE